MQAKSKKLFDWFGLDGLFSFWSVYFLFYAVHFDGSIFNLKLMGYFRKNSPVEPTSTSTLKIDQRSLTQYDKGTKTVKATALDS